MNFKYTLGAIFLFPLLPIMAIQGKRIRKSVPKLPEATGTEGYVDIGIGQTIEVLAIGESTIAGVGVNTHQEGFTGTFAVEVANKLQKNVHWNVIAKSGYTAKKVNEKLIPKINQKHADIIVIGLGANDAFTLNSPTKWKVEIHKMIKTLQAKYPNTLIIFTNMPPIKAFPAFTKLIKFIAGNLVELHGKELEKVVAEYSNVIYASEIIQMETWMKRYHLKGNISDFFSDGVHPAPLTYKIWAKDIAQLVK